MLPQRKMAKKSKLSVASLFGLAAGKQVVVSSSLKLINGETIAQEMERYARILMGILAKNIASAYKPGGNRVYHRTYGALNSAKQYDMKRQIKGNVVNIKCSMGRKAYHRSYFTKNKKANTLLLMDQGYTVSNPAMAEIPWFGYRPAGRIIEKTLAEFESINTLGIEVKIDFGEF